MLKNRPIFDRINCTACGSCINICPSRALFWKPDERGFCYPQADASKCTECGICQQVCPIGRKKELEFDFSPEVYAAYAKNETIRCNSSSGGIFSVLAESVLNDHGAVYGAAFDGDFKVVHIGIRSREELAKLRGSKYVQSFVPENIYVGIKKELQTGVPVLFSGTPCQIAGLKLFLQKEYPNLLLVDLICHGVPSPELFAEYLKYLECRHGKISSYLFRDKHKSWKLYNSKITANGKTVIRYMDQDLFHFFFLTQPVLRESCYHCAYADRGRISDITIGDFWGFQDKYRLRDDDRGLSCVICNSTKGRQFFQTLHHLLDFEKRTLEEAEQGNPVLVSPVRYDKSEQERFWNLFLNSGWETLKKTYYKPSLKERMLLFLRIHCNFFYTILQYIHRKMA